MATQSNQVPGDCVMSDTLQKTMTYLPEGLRMVSSSLVIGSGPFPSQSIGSNMLLPFMNPKPNMKGKYMQI